MGDRSTRTRWHAAALGLIGLLTLALGLLADRVSGHESVAVGTAADQIYVVDGFFDPEQNANLGAYRWTEPLAQLILPDWGPGRVHIRVRGVAASSSPNDITLKIEGTAVGHVVAAPGQPWTVEGEAVTTSRNPAVSLEGPRLDISGESRLLGRVVNGLDIDAPATRDRAWTNLGLLALTALLLYGALLIWAGRPALALLAGTAVPAVYGLLVVYRDRWLDTVLWVAPVVLAGLITLHYLRPARRSLPVRWATLAALVALTAALLLLAQGFLNAFDSDLMYRVTAGLAEYGVPSKYPNTDSWTKYGFGQPVIALPFYWLGKALLAFGGSYDPATRFTVSLTNLPITVLTCWVLYRAARRFTAAGGALAVTATYLLTTYALNYARTFFSEPAGALLLLVAVLLLVPPEGTPVPRPWRILLAGVCLGAMIWIKPAFAIYIPAPGLLVIGLTFLAARQARRAPLAGLRRVLTTAALFAVGPIVAEVVQLGYNYLRYALLFHTGYEREPGFSTPLLEGLGGLLLSPGKSLLLYAPVVLLAPVGLWLLARRGGEPGRIAALLIGGETVLGLIFNALWWAWTGNFAWGPRLILPLLPLLVWPLAMIAECSGIRDQRSGIRDQTTQSASRFTFHVSRFTPLCAAWGGLAALGALVSIPGALVDFQVYYSLHGLGLAGQPGEAATIYDPAQSPLWVEPGYLLQGLTAAIHRPTLAAAGLPPLWDTLVPGALTVVALLAAWLATRGIRDQRAEISSDP